MNSSSGLILFQDVPGAPVRMGEPVLIQDASGDGSLDARFLGQRGVVVALVYDDPLAQFPADPLIQVRVEALGDELFFRGELERTGGWVWHPSLREERHAP